MGSKAGTLGGMAVSKRLGATKVDLELPIIGITPIDLGGDVDTVRFIYYQ